MTNTSNYYKTFALITTVLLVIAAIFFFLGKGCNNPEPSLTIDKATYDAAMDSMTRTINKLGQIVSEKNVMLTNKESAEAVLKLKNDSLSKALLSVISKNTLSATAIQTTTAFDTSSPTVVTIAAKDSLQPVADSLLFDSCISEFPVYASSFKDNEIEYFVLARRDTVFNEVRIQNIQTIDQTFEKNLTKGKLLSVFYPKILKVHIINTNSHVSTDGAQSYHLFEVKTGTGIKLAIGAAIGIVAYKYLDKKFSND